jgi:hypothetical protein
MLWTFFGVNLEKYLSYLDEGNTRKNIFCKVLYLHVGAYIQ